MSRGIHATLTDRADTLGAARGAASPRAGDTAPHQQTTTRRRIGNAWPKTTYIYRCPICNKRFERTSMDATLRAHKNPSGHTCAGRHGIYEGTK